MVYDAEVAGVPRGRIRDLTGWCAHVTHCCPYRAFLLKFRQDRRAYVERLPVVARGFEIDILDYVVTSNHAPVLAWVPRGGELSAAQPMPSCSVNTEPPL